MATRDGIKAAFATLRAGGSEPPPEWAASDGSARRDEKIRSIDAAEVVLAPITDEALAGAVLAWLQSSRARWWPAPGQLLALAPRAPTGLRLVDSQADEPCPVLREFGVVGVDQAIRTHRADGTTPAACGACPSCPFCFPVAEPGAARRTA